MRLGLYGNSGILGLPSAATATTARHQPSSHLAPTHTFHSAPECKDSRAVKAHVQAGISLPHSSIECLRRQVSNTNMGVIPVAIALVGAWFLSKAWTLYQNYQAAAKSGLPYLVWPVDPENVRIAVSSKLAANPDTASADLLCCLTGAVECALARPSAGILPRARWRGHHGLGVRRQEPVPRTCRPGLYSRHGRDEPAVVRRSSHGHRHPRSSKGLCSAAPSE